MIDLQLHLLPGFGIGPARLPEAVELARAARAAGITTAVCAPPFDERNPPDPAAIDAALERTRAALADAAVDLTVISGGELALGSLMKLDQHALRAASIDGAGRWLLVGLPERGWPVDAPRIIEAVERAGYRVIIAHPERADAVQRQPDRMRDVVGRGSLVQLEAGSLVGEHGAAAQRAAKTLMRSGMAHFIASGAHAARGVGAPRLIEGLRAAAAAVRVSEEDLRWLVQDGPAAVIGGSPVRPPRFGRGARFTPDPDRPPPRGA